MGAICSEICGTDEDSPKKSTIVHYRAVYFAAIADQDKKAKVDSNEWISYLQFGKLQFDDQNNKVESIDFCRPNEVINDEEFKGECDEETDALIIKTNIGTQKKGRGAEFSAICRHKKENKVYIGDDKTGIIYALDHHFNLCVTAKVIQNKESGELSYIAADELNEENIDDRGYKIEWMTYKDGEGLYVGSTSCEFVDFDTRKVSPGMSFIVKMEEDNKTKDAAQTIQWMDKYNAMRIAVGAVFPGWIDIECIIWSKVHQSWFVLPRYMSLKVGFDETFDKRGCHLMLIVPEDGSDVKYVHIQLKKSEDEIALTTIDDMASNARKEDIAGAKKIGAVTTDDVQESDMINIQKDVMKSLFYANNGAKGFSAAQFVPQTQDKVILAVRSLETKEGISSSLCVFDIEGNVIVDEHPFKGNRKYEGLIVYGQ